MTQVTAQMSVSLDEMAGDHSTARAAYQHAARRTTNLPERRHLLARAALLR